MFKRSKIKAFTLLECLVALFVISGSVLVIQGLTRLARSDMTQLSNSSSQDWQSFCNQMRSELDGSTFVRADGQFLYVKKTDDWRFGVPSSANDFRKSHSNGSGYQPMLYGVASSEITADANRVVTIILHFQKGPDKCFIYKFPESPAESKPASSSTPSSSPPSSAASSSPS